MQISLLRSRQMKISLRIRKIDANLTKKGRTPGVT